MFTGEKLGKAIAEAINRKGVSKADVAKHFKIKPPSVTGWIRTGRISKEHIGKLVEYFSDVAKPEHFGIENMNIISTEKRESNTTVIGGLDPWDSDTPLTDDDVEVPFYKEICLSAGSGFADDIEDHNGYKLRFSYSTLRRKGINPDNVVCVSADGDSMEPVFPDGTTLGINTAEKHIKDGKIYAFNHGGLLRTKILYRLPENKVRIRSYNSEIYQDEEHSLDEISIIGRVFWRSVMD